MSFCVFEALHFNFACLLLKLQLCYLNLVDVHFLVGFLHVFEAKLHGINLKTKSKCE